MNRDALSDTSIDGRQLTVGELLDCYQSRAAALYDDLYTQYRTRLLPEECIDPDCGAGHTIIGPCQGTGQIWDEGLVALIAKEIDSFLTGSNLNRFAAERMARAVLAALAGEVGK